MFYGVKLLFNHLIYFMLPNSVCTLLKINFYVFCTFWGCIENGSRWLWFRSSWWFYQSKLITNIERLLPMCFIVFMLLVFFWFFVLCFLEVWASWFVFVVILLPSADTDGLFHFCPFLSVSTDAAISCADPLSAIDLTPSGSIPAAHSHRTCWFISMITCPLLVSVVRQMYPVHIILSYLFTIHFNIIIIKLCC